MNSTPALDLLEQAASELALSDHQKTANQVRAVRPRFAALLNAVEDTLDEIDAARHGLADSATERALRVAYSDLRPSPCPK